MTLSNENLQTVLKNRPFHYFDRVDSTNDVAIEWLKTGAKTGSVVVADEQVQGRGRMGRIWHTPPQVALALSVILHPTAEDASRVSLLGALCVAELCESLGIQGVGIKWPNDVQIDGRKVCGVLPEAVWQDNQLVGVVLGLGVNVRVVFEGELAQTATSLETVLSQRLDRSQLIGDLLNRVDNWFQRLHGEDFMHAWKRRLVTLNQRVTIQHVTGVAIDTDISGALMVKTDGGTLERVIAGDVNIL